MYLPILFNIEPFDLSANAFNAVLFVCAIVLLAICAKFTASLLPYFPINLMFFKYLNNGIPSKSKSHGVLPLTVLKNVSAST